MTRYHKQKSTNHKCVYIERLDIYRLSWTVDFYYRGSRMRFPRRFSRDTDEAGARRFCRRWGIPLPARLTNS